MECFHFNLLRHKRHKVAHDGATGKSAVAEYEMAVKLFAFVLRKALGGKPLRKPAAAVCACLPRPRPRAAELPEAADG